MTFDFLDVAVLAANQQNQRYQDDKSHHYISPNGVGPSRYERIGQEMGLFGQAVDYLGKRDFLGKAAGLVNNGIIFAWLCLPNAART